METVSWSFTSNELSNLGDAKDSVKIKNPISSDLDTMRTSLIPNIISAINSI